MKPFVLIAFWTAAAPLMVWSLYLAILAVAAFLPRRARRTTGELPRLAVVVPAHNEEAQIGATVRCLMAEAARTAPVPKVFVVADNCTDDTARAAAMAGAKVLLRHDPSRRGKGYALMLVQRILAPRTDWDALVVIDADSRVEPGFFTALQTRFAQGAQALQAHYAPGKRTRSPRARLLAVAWSVFNYLRPAGRSRLGFTSGILGNGFAIGREALERVPFSSGSIVEDLEHGLLLAEAGVPVEFVREAIVRGAVEETAAGARSQRVRWESGRLQTLRAWAPRLLARQPGGSRLLRAEALLDLSVPPLAVFGGLAMLFTSAAAAAGAIAPALAGLATMAILGTVIAAAMVGARVPLRCAAGLLFAPVYLIWKLSLYAQSAFWRQTAWVRTAR